MTNRAILSGVERHVFILIFLISCSRLHLISLECESRPVPFFPADERLERLADPNRRLEGECMATQKITRSRHED
jgi:hypothetical protein